MGFVSAIIILYMSEIAPRKVRGAIVSGYQFCITIGILLASCVDYGTENKLNSSSYRIPIGLQMLWAIILGTGLFLLPESPRYFVRKNNLEAATTVLTRLRGQPEGSELVQAELSEIVANNEVRQNPPLVGYATVTEELTISQYEMSVIPQGSYFATWLSCFSGGLRNPSSNLRRTILGTSLQSM